MPALAGLLYDGPVFPAVDQVRGQQEERIGKLEKDLAKLEVIVERVISGMEEEHKAMRESRQEDRLAMKELGNKMEKSVSDLAVEMKKIAERNAEVDSKVLAKQSRNEGAVGLGLWVMKTALALAALVIAYDAGRNRGSQPPSVIPPVIRQAQ